MRFLRKINKGLILTIIVLVLLIAYLVNIENQRKEDKEEIRKTCEEFIEFTDKYSVLPEEILESSEDVLKSKIEEYKAEMKKELEKLMIENEQARDLQFQILDANLENGYNDEYASEGIRIDSEREITKISGYQFEADQVTVTFKSTLKITTENSDEEESQKTIDVENDEIILQKIDGKWKIVYSNLRYDNNYYYYDDTIVMY